MKQEGSALLQELQTFLEADGVLSNSLDWQNLQPIQSTFLEGATRLPKQLLGTVAKTKGTAASNKGT